MRRFITTVLILAIVAVIANDSVRYLKAQSVLRSTTYDVTQWAGNYTSKDMSQEQAAAQVAQKAAPYGVTVYQYGTTETTVRVWSRSEVKGTVVAGIIANMAAGKPFSEAKKAPFIITNYREARYM